jgi:hypothetical protein
MTIPIIQGDTEPDHPGGHMHRFGIFPEGNGNTDIVNDHMHMIVDGKVLPSGEDHHTHPDVPFPLKNVDRLL